MGLKSFDRHKESLRDGREVYFEGERVTDVTTHPILGAGMAFAAIDYRLAEEKEHRELAVCTDREFASGHAKDKAEKEYNDFIGRYKGESR
jgi:4-hydroxyphenylacetate 3-monooxygenase